MMIMPNFFQTQSKKFFITVSKTHNLFLLAGQSLWLFRKWVWLPHHLHALPPTSTSAPSGAATSSKTGAGCAVPSVMAAWVTRIASSSLTRSSSSSPYECLIWQFFTNFFPVKWKKNSECAAQEEFSLKMALFADYVDAGVSFPL